MALITASVTARASAARTVIEFVFAGWPPLVLQPLPGASTTSLSDAYPRLDYITPLDLVSADSKGNPGDGLGPPNRVAIFARQRTDRLKGYVNVLIRLANLLYANFLDRDGIQVGSLSAETTYMKGPLDVGGNRIINLAPATDAFDLVNFDQFKDVQFAYEDALDLSLQSLLKRDGSSVMANPLDMGVGLPGNRLINLAVPSLAPHAITKGYYDSLVSAFSVGYLARTGALPMQNAGQAWSMGQNPVRDVADPTVDSDAATKGYFDTTVAVGGQEGVPVGAVLPHFGTTIPAGFFPCDGREVSRVEYQALFAIIGIAYGTPSGSTTFVLPDLRGRLVIGQDNMGGTFAGRVTELWGSTLGGSGGAQSHVLTAAELPVHEHDFDDNYFADGSGGALEGKATANSNAGFFRTRASATASTGSGNAHNNMQPSMACRWIIRAG